MSMQCRHIQTHTHTYIYIHERQDGRPPSGRRFCRGRAHCVSVSAALFTERKTEGDCQSATTTRIMGYARSTVVLLASAVSFAQASPAVRQATNTSEPCAVVSAAYASQIAAAPAATPTIAASVAYDCLLSVPLGKEAAIEYLDSIEPYLEWQSGTSLSSPQFSSIREPRRSACESYTDQPIRRLQTRPTRQTLRRTISTRAMTCSRIWRPSGRSWRATHTLASTSIKMSCTRRSCECPR